MALEQITFNIAAFNDSDAGGNNYYSAVIYEVFNSNDTLADIYSDAAGANQIDQDGISNISDSIGECVFYIDTGDYYVLVNSKKKIFKVGFYHSELGGVNDINSHISEAINYKQKNLSLDKFLSRNINYDIRVNPQKDISTGTLSVRSNQRKPKLIILLGQSNAEGRGTTSDAGINNDVVGYRESIQIWTGSAFEDLRIPTTSSDPLQNNDALPGRYGIELALANFYDYNEDVAHMVKFTDGGTFMGQWLATEDIIPVGEGDPNDPDNDGDLSIADPTGGVLDNEAWTKVQDAQVAMDTLFGAGNYEQVLVMLQGEANGTSVTQRPRFKRQRETFNARWRTRLGSPLRIITAHILNLNAEYIEINQVLSEIEYEDDVSYLISTTGNLPTDDGIHLNYHGLAQLGRSVFNEIENPTSKKILYPSGRFREVVAAQNLLIERRDTTAAVTGTTVISYTPKDQCVDGREMTVFRRDAGAGVTIRHLTGDGSIYALFNLTSGASTGLSEGQAMRFVADGGIWYQINYV